MAAELFNSVVSDVASKVADSLFDRIRREISYAFKYQSYVEKLRSQLVDLKNKRQRLQQTVEEAERQGGEVYDDVKQWLVKMTELIEQADKLISEDEDAAKNKRCIKGLCPNLMTRRKLSKEAVIAGNAATDLLTEGNFTNVFYLPAPERAELLNVVRGYQQFDSRTKIFQEVVEVLKDDKFSMIGVYGMGGVGKTTLVKQVSKKVVEEKIFDEVAMAEVTQNPDLKTIQDKIAYDLGLTFLQHESTLFARSGRLRQRLKKGNRVLVILDNIWAKLDLEALGIPCGVDERGQCTILLTSRTQHVLCNDMNSQKNFKIEVLSDRESMALFRESGGDHPSIIQPLEAEIVRKCGGLPIAIKTMGNALKNKEPPVWKDTLNQLRNSNPKDIPGMEKDVYSTIKLSYDLLEIDEAKSLFLLCALKNAGSQIPINDLVMYGMGLGWFKRVRTLEEGRNRVHALIENLKTSSLLLDGDNKHVVKMHDIIHAVAVSIAADKLIFNILNVDDLKEEQENAIKEDSAAISLHYEGIQELPERLECTKLKLFLLFANFKHEGISLRLSDLFFEEMKELRVLHLTRIGFPSISSSLGCLSNLRTLSLNYFNSVEDVEIIGKLTKLEILSFRDSNIEGLPLEIGQLTRLKLLDLSNCLSLKVIAPNVISKLSRLEELYMVNSFTQWGKGEEGGNASLVELKALSKLTTLELNIPNVTVMPQNLVSVELERYKICVGYRWDWTDRNSSRKYERMLKLKGLDKSIILGSGMKKLFKNIEYLRLSELTGFQNVVNKLQDREDFQQLKHLQVENDSEILYIANSVGQIAFPLLESLFLRNLINLEKVCQGQLTEGQSFSKLKIIDVDVCDKLKHLFSFCMAQNCFRLQEIKVANCKNLKLIVGEESENHTVHENERISFSQLQSLRLIDLPQLTSSGFHQEISRILSTTPSASKEIVEEDDREDFMTGLFNNKVIFPVLEKLELLSLNLKKIWPDQFLPMSTFPCQNLTKLTVRKCGRLEFLFPYSVVNSLVQLQILEIESCESMRRVIDTTGIGRDEEQMIDSVVFPKLEYLELSGLPKLTRFMSMNTSDSEDNNILHTGTQSALFDEKVRLPNLKELRIESVDKLTSIFSSIIIMESRFERLETLNVWSCGSVEVIIEEETSSSSGSGSSSSRRFDVFPQLIILELWNLPKLKIIYQGKHVLELPALKKIRVSECDRVEIFFASSELLVWETESQQPIFLFDLDKVRFSKLEQIKIRGMDNLRKIWQLHHQFTGDSFNKLKILEISNCHQLTSVFSSNIIVGRRFETLEFLIVDFCGSIEDVIEEETSSSCNSSSWKFDMFPQLINVELWNLPKLKSIYQGMHILEWPALKHLYLKNCHKVEILFGSSGSELLTRERKTQLPIILVDHHKVRFPNLEQLRIQGMKNLRKIWQWHHQLTLDSFNNLRKLEMTECSKLTSVFSSNIIIIGKRFERLETLTVRNCSLIEEIIEEEISSSSNSRRFDVFPQLINLQLWGLPNLRSVYQGIHILEWSALKNLSMSNCDKVEILFASSEFSKSQQPIILVDFHKVVFLNLSTLQVKYCDGLKNLVTLSTAESPVKLARMEISNCKMVENIMEMQVGGVKEDPIVFSQLEYLELDTLPRLESFCLGNYTLEFPYLEHVVVGECPSMNTFSQGVLDTPKLHKVQLRKGDDKEERWEGNLNSTIQKLFQGMCAEF